MKKLILILFSIMSLYGNLCMGQDFSREAVIKNNEAVEHLARFPKKEDIQIAIQLLRESVAVDSTYRLAYVNMIQSMMMLGQTEEAMEIVDKALEHVPEDADLYFIKGILFAKLHKRKLSEEMLQKSIDLMEHKPADYALNPYLSFKRALAKAFKGDKYIAFIELLAGQMFFYDVTFNLNIWELYQSELEYISHFERGKEIREFWALPEIAERGKYVIDYER